MYNYQDVPSTLIAQIEKFVVGKPQKRELYFYAEDLPFEIPEGKVVRVTVDYVALSKLKNEAMP